MTLNSLIDLDNELTPVEVEISLLPGLPTIQIIGLPDAAIKESIIKIKSALRLQGFQFPKGRMVVVNLRPSQIRKTSLGLELAITMGILLKTDQVQLPEALDLKKTIFYGEINLQGEVFCPEDILYWAPGQSIQLVTGPIEFKCHLSRFEIKQLSDILGGRFVGAENPRAELKRPGFGNYKFNLEQARILSIIAAGEHSALIAGPSGSGKTTLASSVSCLLREPNEDACQEIKRIWRKNSPTWRPVINPHHSATPIALIGGGVPPRFGDITRAHNGVLIMDEFLEFSTEVFESLREPIESGKITISRSGYEKNFPANFLLIATTNLCQCGNFVPRREHSCTCGTRKKELYLSRLNGPMVDRFPIIVYSDGWLEKDIVVGLDKVFDQVCAAIEFAKNSRGQNFPNKYFLSAEDIGFDCKSRRRQNFIQQIARTCADLDQSISIRPTHAQEAYELCLKSHQLLTTQLALY